MSTEIKSALDDDSDTTIELGMLEGYIPNPRAFLRVRDDSKRGLINVTRADFLAAVATECNVRIVPADAIVIERGELPEVVKHGVKEIAAGGIYRTIDKELSTYTARYAREVGLNLLALADYLDAHPPVDEAQVKALARLIADHVDPASLVGSGERVSTTSADLARSLVLAGVRIEAAK